MPTPTCIITGCALIDTQHQRWAWGDLHKLGDVYIFNAVLGKTGETYWQDSSPVDRKAVYAPEESWFERRGVIIFPIPACTLNVQALEYLK